MDNNNSSTILEKRIFYGEEQVISDQILHITGTIVVEGGLRLKNCTVDLRNGRLEIPGTLFMESCTVENPGQDAIHIDSGAYVIIRDSSFCFTEANTFTTPVLNQQAGSWVSLEHCTFKSTVQIHFSGMYSLFHLPYGKVENSMFCDFTDMQVLSAHQILCCTFERCGAIYGGELQEDGVIADSKFINCGSIRADDSTVKHCRFQRLKADLCVERTTVEDCMFEDIDCDYDALLCIADSLVTRCTFRDIRLVEDSRLVTAVDSGEVEHCKFIDISVELDPADLFYGEKLSGGLFKKRRTFDVVDEDTCTGLDDIRFI